MHTELSARTDLTVATDLTARTDPPATNVLPTPTTPRVSTKSLAARLSSPAETAGFATLTVPDSTTAPSSILLEVKSLDFTYPGGRQALRDVHFCLHSGEWALLTGVNGSGKTTLSRLLMGLLLAPKGCITWQGEDTAGVPVYRMAEKIGYVFQQPEHTFTAPTVWEELTYSLHGGLPQARRPELTADEKRRADDLLRTAGLHHKNDVSPYLLSGGEKRLLSVISQLIVPKELYILDEPTSGMDYAGIARLITLCRSTCNQGAALLMITHDPELVETEADTLLKLQDGKMMSVLLAPELL
ncbi:MAG: ATP-binding cassette domain-containing protein [Bacillota bacterium]